MSIVSLSNVSHRFGIEEIFKKISFSIEHTTKLGLIGKNGCGKTTLLNFITRKLIPEEGEVFKAKSVKIAYLTQVPKLDTESTLEENVLSSRQDYIQLSEELRKTELALSEQEISLERFSQIQQKFEMIDGYNFKTKMKLVLTSLNFPEHVWQQKVKDFSGGEQTRIQLATILLKPFDLLLLDEPTNHLDIEMIYWLEKYLVNLEKPYVIISHDRNFLDKTVSNIIEIRNLDLDLYSGNYSFYKEESKARLELREKTAKKQQNKIDKLQKQIKQYRIWGRSRDSEKMFARAKELEKRLDKIEKVEPPKKEKAIKLDFVTKKRSGNDVYTFKDMSFGFPKNTLASNINLRIFYKDKIAVLGKNGCGKTTFLKLLNKEIKPLKGIAKKGASLKIGYYEQMHLELDNDKTVKQSLWSLIPQAHREYIYSYLAKFGFIGDEIEKKISVLSGGEKARLYLAKLIHDKPNFLILDEPTNHLDINMISYLEKALQEFDGTIIFVSHDRYFIEKVATKKWMFQHETIEEVDEKLEDLFFQKNSPKKTVTNHTKKTRKNKKTNPLILKKLHQKIKHLTKDLENNKNEIKSLEWKFTDAEIYNNEKKLKSLTNKINLLKEEIETQTDKLNQYENEYLDLLEG